MTKNDIKTVNGYTLEELFSLFNSLNEDSSHFMSRDDICTPMECVKKMCDYIPNAFWNKQDIKILDPCSGNGNFGAYLSFKTNPDNIFYNEINPLRLENCKRILNPKNLNNCDAFSLLLYRDRFDLIVANPPYSGGGNKNQSLSNKFIELSIDLLNHNGYLCFITPNNWMTYNNNNTTLKKLLREGSFLVIDNDAKQYFPTVGSSFTIIVWQKGILSNKTYVKNSFLKKDEQFNLTIPNDLPFIPLYLSSLTINLVKALILKEENNLFCYRCDLHNFTKKQYLSDIQNDTFQFPTIHTARKTRFATFKQDIFDKYLIIVPLSTYFLPYVVHNFNVTQSVGYIAFNKKAEADSMLSVIKQDPFVLLIHITRYGNFNNIMVLKHLNFLGSLSFSCEENLEIKELRKLIKY